MSIAFYQGHFPVGAIDANAERILAVAKEAQANNTDLLFFPELALSGYPPEDLLFQADFKKRIETALLKIIKELPLGIVIGIGLPEYQDGKVYNALLLLQQGKVLYRYHKQALPNYGVFDERRYFIPGEAVGIFQHQGQKIGLLICEDLWQLDAIKALSQEQLDLVVVVNASPFEAGKTLERLEVAKAAQLKLKVPILYVHQVGVQDELIFDGGSFYLDQQGQVQQWPQFVEGCFVVSAEAGAGSKLSSELQQNDKMAEIYQALCFSLNGYVAHHHFPGVLVGLSGGIDSALTLAIAVDALGKDKVEAVLMPSRYSADMSLEDAKSEAEALGVKYHIIPIESLFQTFLNEVSPHFVKSEWDLTEENIQARLRGMILMALSNKSGKMVVSTTNKSELAVGYGTLYGDMAGGFALLKDVYKTEVYELASYRNAVGPVIPERVITRAPSAELRENQTDQDALPDYGFLDRVLQRYIEENQDAAVIKIDLGQAEDVEHIFKLIQRNEYKRTQAPVGPKISKRAFGKEWRMPIMSHKQLK